MQRSSTKIFILSILVMAILVVIASSLVLDFSKTFQDSEVNIAEAATDGQFSAALESNGDGLGDGEVKSGYSVSGTAISTASGLYTFLKNASSGSYGYLTTNITLDSNYVPYTKSDSGARAEDISFAAGAVLDGCGKTVTLSTSASTTAKSTQYFGGLMHNCSGTIKNLKVNTSASMSYSSSKENVDQGAGLIIGTLNSTGLVDNCYITWSGSGTFGNAKRDGTRACLGGVCARSLGGTIRNTTVEITTDLRMNGVNSWTKTWGQYVGGFAGYTTGAAQFKNITMTGSATLVNHKPSTGTGSGTSNDYVGAIIGYTESGSPTLNGVKIGGTFNVTTNGDVSRRGLLVGHASATLTITNILYMNITNNWYKRFNTGNTWICGNVENTTGYVSNNTIRGVTIDESKFGYCKGGSDNMWIGQMSTYTTPTTSINGNFVDTVTIGGSSLNVAGVAVNAQYVPCIAKSNVDGDITGYTFSGLYACVANETTTLSSSTGPTCSVDGESQLSNPFIATYNGTAITGISTTNKVYRNGSQVGSKTVTVDGWTCSDTIQALGTYEITSAKSGCVNFEYGANYYCAVYLGPNTQSYTAYTAHITLDIRLTDGTQGYTGIYDGQPHTLSVLPSDGISGFQGETYADCINTLKYSNDGGSTYTLNSPQEYTNVGTYTIYYQATFKEHNGHTYAPVTGHKTITINPAPIKILFDDTKELYDSIIDTTTIGGVNYYDFIYANGLETFDRINSFSSQYSKYFTKFIPANTAVSSVINNSTYDLSNYIEISFNQFSISNHSTSDSNNKAYYLTYHWKSSITSEFRNNYVIDNGDIPSDEVIIATTGSGRSENSDFTYCLDAKNNAAGAYADYKARVVVVPNTSFNYSSGTIDGLADFINGHYYDIGDASYTSVTITGTITYNRPIDGTRVMASYKTINGNGQTFNVAMTRNDIAKQTSLDTTVVSEIGGYTNTYSTNANEPSNASNLETGFSYNTEAAYKKQYPAYTTVEGTVYYGAALVVAVNYGVITGLNINYTISDNTGGLFDSNQYYNYMRLNFMGHKSHNTAMGQICGINAGIISGNTINANRLIRFVGQDSSKIFAVGQICGVNVGTITTTSINTTTRITDENGGDATHNWHVTMQVLGSASTVYFGTTCGINGVGGSISGLSYTSAAPLYINVTGNLYAGGFVGYNEGSLASMTLTGAQATENYTHEVYWTSSFDSGTAGNAFDVRGNELYFSTSTGNIYAGGIAGWNAYGATITNPTAAITGAAFNAVTTSTGKMAVLGGIAGVNEGTVSNANVTNAGTMNAGSARFTSINTTTDPDVSVAAGGLVGVNAGLANSGNHGGIITGSKVIINKTGKLNGTRGAGTRNVYVGGLLGVGCEEGTYTAQSRVTFAGIAIEEGTLATSVMFNYGQEGNNNYSYSIGANHGCWGYLTGYYNSVVSSNYTHAYGSLIWYTQYDTLKTLNPLDYYIKYLYGFTNNNVATILGYTPYAFNDLPASTNITGIAGIGLTDCGDGYVASSLLAGVQVSGSDIIMSYNAFENYGVYTGWDCSVNGYEATITTASQTNVTKATTYTAGTIKVSQAAANAVITNPKIAASVAYFVLRPWITLSTNNQYLDYILGTDNTSDSKYRYRYCAGYAVISGWSETLYGEPWNGSMNSLKTLDGNGQTLTYIPGTNNQSFSIANGDSVWPNTGSGMSAPYTSTSSSNGTFYGSGNIIGVNYGTIKNLNVALEATSGTTKGVVSGTQGRNYTYGIIAGINAGTITGCTVTIRGGGYTGLAGSTSGNMYAAGGVAGISHGTVNGCTVKFEGGTTLAIYGDSSTYRYNTSNKGYLGGVVGLVSGGIIEDCVVVGKGNIKAINTQNGLTDANLGAYVGGIAGMMLLDNTSNEQVISATVGTVVSTSAKNFVVALIGEIGSASSGNYGGSGYITGMAFAGTSANNITSLLSSHNFGTIFVVGYGTPNIVSNYPAKLQNTIFGRAANVPASNSYSNFSSLDIVLFEDYSVRGVGAVSFVSALTIVEKRASVSTFLQNSNAAFSSASISVRCQQTTAGIASTLTLQNTSSIIQNETNVTDGTNTVAYASITSQFSTSLKMIKYTLAYAVTIAYENYEYNADQANSPFMNFITGTGNLPLYSGAKKATLTDNIRICKPVNGAVEFKEGKELDGAGYTITYVWGGSVDTQVKGLTETAANATQGANNASNSAEYPYNYNYDGTVYYGVSNLISINKGTIRRVNITYTEAAHGVTSLNTNTAYGGLVGINVGTIENCTVTDSAVSATYFIGAANVQTVVSLGVGINVGTINNLTVTLSNTFTVVDTVDSTSTSTANIIFGLGVGINGYNYSQGGARGVITGLTVINNGAARIGSASQPANEKDRRINSVTMGGLVGIDAGGELHYSTIRGTGLFAINSQYQVAGVFTGTYDDVSTISEEDFNTAQGESSLYYRTGGAGTEQSPYTYALYTGSYADHPTLYIRRYSTVTYNQINIDYVHIAVGVALADNEGTSLTNNTGVTVYTCVLDNVNKIDYMLIDYTGRVQYYASNYMAGVAFAKATTHTHVSNFGTAYKGIMWNDQYNTDQELYTVYDGYAAGANMAATIAAAGLAIMGWIPSSGVGDDANFMSGAQVKANASNMSYNWDPLYNGKLIVTVPEVTMKEKNPFKSIATAYLPSGVAKQDIAANALCYTLNVGLVNDKKVGTLVFDITYLTTSKYIVNESTDVRYKGNAMKIAMEFNYPYVEINDVYQLVQFMWFDSDDESNMLNYYLRTYLDQIKELISEGLKQADGINPYGAWASLKDDDIDLILSHYAEDEYFIYYYSTVEYYGSHYFYIFIEKYYDEDGDEIAYYSANEGRLGDDIVLDKYGNATPDFGFSSTTAVEFSKNKVLDGQNHSIELIATNRNTRTYNDSSMSLSKWYDSSNENALAEVSLSDKADTPNKDENGFIYGGFVGINRGTLKNINFTFRKNSVLNITGSNLGTLEVRRNMFVGLVSAYSTGVIDGCTLSMEQNSQVFVNKYLPSLDGNFFDPKSDHDYYGGVYMGGFAGILGKNAVISNCTVDFGNNTRFGANNVGNDGIGKGHIYTYVGGFTGMMLGGSQIYNAKIEGASTSRIFAFINSQNFTRVVCGAGGLVGVNTTYSTWNIWGLGQGKIDGVIYNWQGRTISSYWNGGLKLFGWEPNLGGDRKAATIYELGGNVAGIIGNMGNNDTWVTTTNDIDNLYYTFDVDTYAVTAQNQETSMSLYPSSGATPVDMDMRTHENNTIVPSANVSVSDARNSSNSLNLLTKVLAVWELAYDKSGVSNTGITITGGTAETRNSGKVVVTTDYTSVTVDSNYTKLSTIGKVLSWQDRDVGSNILCSFTVGDDNPSAIVWQITIDDAVSDTGSNLSDPSGTAITEIPVYKFAQSLEEAQQYKQMNYVILRGQGHGMNLYYCLGDSAVLSPNRLYYTNENSGDERVYQPMKALMYDGSTDATNTAVTVYDSKGVKITRISDSEMGGIITDAGSSIERTIYVYNTQSKQYQLKGVDQDVSGVGSYELVFTIKTNGLNNNAYVDSNHRVMFFGTSGEEATITYNDNVYVKRNDGYYRKVLDETLIGHLENVTPSNGIYTWEAVDYMKKNGAFYYNDRVTGETATALASLSGEVETYTIYMVIAPISINLTSITKLYDGSNQFTYTSGTSQKNYTTFNASVVETFTYSTIDSPTVSTSRTSHKLTLDGTAGLSSDGTAITPDGEFDSAEVGNRSATFLMQPTPLSYTLYEYNEDERVWYKLNITTYYLKDKNNAKTYFTIDALTTLQSVNDSTHIKTYGYNGQLTDYTITNSDACTVKIYKAAAPTIAFDSAIVLKYDYIDEYIDYVTDSNLLSHIRITNSLGDVWYASDSTYFKSGDFTIEQLTTDIKDVDESGHEAQVRVTYNGAQFQTGTNQVLNLKVYVAPAALNIVRAVKDYDGNNNLTNATVVLSGFRGDDTQGAITGTYSQINVGKNLNVTINTTDAVSFTIGNVTYSYNTIFANYYFATNPQAVGVIAPLPAKILNAYKTFDGTANVTYGNGETDTKILIKAGLDGNGAILDFEPAGTYTSIQAGTSNLRVNLEAFTYTAANGAPVTRQRLKDGNTTTNYYVDSQISIYNAPASILPRAIVITDVSKEYDGTAELGTFNIASGKLANDSISRFDGAYSSANVAYSNNKYNNVILNGATLNLVTNDGTTTQNQSYTVLKSSGSNTNYYLATGVNDVALNGTTYTITGRGVIIPAKIMVTSVIKYYDRSSAFNTASADVTGEISYNGRTLTNVDFTGKMYKNSNERVDAIDECDVKVDVTTFTYSGTYNWVPGTNYRVGDVNDANPTFSGVGQILKLTIGVDSNASSGKISNIYFTTSTGNKTVNRNHYASAVTSIFEATYAKGQQYKTSNFCGTITVGGVGYSISGGVCSQLSISFTLDNVAENAGIYAFEISMESGSNYTLDSNNKTFYFNIDRKMLDASNIQIVMANVSKVYNNSVSAPTVNKATAARAVNVTGEADAIPLTGTFSDTYSISVGSSCINAATYSQGNGSNQFVLSQDVSNLTSTNYKFSGTITSTTCAGIYNANNYGSLTTYTISKATIAGITSYAKDFDSTTSFTVELQGINEPVEATYTTTGIIWPGEYTSCAVGVSLASNNYSELNGQSIDLTINKATVVLERQYISANNFKLAFAISNLGGFTFLTAANPSFESSMVSDVVANGLSAQDSAKAQFVIALNNLFVLHCNGSNAPTLITLAMINAINIVVEDDSHSTLEIILNAEETLDNVTITDRCSIYMKGIVEGDLDASVKNSNVATSSSELENGQFNGTYVSTGTAISSLADLYSFLTEGSGVGYLTRNIYGYDAVAGAVTTLASGNTLDGNGYTIEITGEIGDAAFFVDTNAGTIQNVNFKFSSSKEIDKDQATIGLIVGTNGGTITNVSLDIARDLNIKDNTVPNIGGLVGTNTGNLNHISIVYSSDITCITFGGLAYAITAGTVNYIAVRNNRGVTTIAGKPLANTATTINYVIDGISTTDTLVASGTLTNVYGQSNPNTAISIYNNGYTNGFVDYYFTKNSFFTTNGSLHNVYNAQAQTNTNTSYYYGYNSNEAGYYVAIEVIAPVNRFIWEAFGAYYTTYSTNLNRAVGLFALSNTANDTPTELASAGPAMTTANATKFTPVIGVIVTTVISGGTNTIQEYEYTGDTITAEFAATSGGDEITLFISGVDVGIYTEYYQEIEEQESVSGITWNTSTFSAQILTSSTAVGEQSIMLIIVPNQLSTSATLTKEYDSTNIAETHFDIDSNGTDDLYAVGEFDNTAVGTGYEVQYYSTTKTVAAYNNGNGYTFVTYYLSGYDQVASKHIYTVKFIYINGNAFTSSTNVSSLTKAAFAQGYYQLATLEEIQALANDTTHNQIIYSNGIGSISNLTSVNVYDLTFARTVNNTTHAVTWGASVYYSTSVYNVSNKTRNANYNYLLTAGAFSETSIYVAQSTTTQYVVSANGGSITKRTINATYGNLEQSYRGELSAITVNIANINDIENLPYSLTNEQKASLITALNNELESASFSGNVLAETYNDNSNPDHTKLTYTNSKYYATNAHYEEIKLTALDGSYSVSTNLQVRFNESAVLVLRYFAHNTTDRSKYNIDTFADLLMVDAVEYGEVSVDESEYVASKYYTYGNSVYTLATGEFDQSATYYAKSDYQDLDYIITANLNGKGQLVETFANTFNGTITGAYEVESTTYNRIVRNFALVGTNATSLFGTVASGAAITNIDFANVLAIATQNNAVIGIVAGTNNGSISNINIDAVVASDGAITIKAIGGGTIANATAVIETTKNITVANEVVEAERLMTIILYRTYGLNGSVEFRLASANEATRSTFETKAKAILKENRLNTPITITNEVAQISNFRQYWAWVNLFRYLDPSSSVTIEAGVVTGGSFIGHEFIL